MHAHWRINKFKLKKWTNDRMNEWTNEQTNEWLSEKMNSWKNEQKFRILMRQRCDKLKTKSHRFTPSSIQNSMTWNVCCLTICRKALQLTTKTDWILNIILVIINTFSRINFALKMFEKVEFNICTLMPSISIWMLFDNVRLESNGVRTSYFSEVFISEKLCNSWNDIENKNIEQTGRFN